jgi:hypothetical protein
MHRLFRFFLFFSLRRFFSSDAGHAINPMPGFSKPAFRFIPRFFYFLYISSRFCHVYMILEFRFLFLLFSPLFYYRPDERFRRLLHCLFAFWHRRQIFDFGTLYTLAAYGVLWFPWRCAAPGVFLGEGA